VGLSLLVVLSVLGCSSGGSSPDPDPRAGTAIPANDDLTSVRQQAVLHPDEPYWPYRAGVLLTARDFLADAETAFQSSLHRNPVYTPALTALAGLYYEAGRYGEGARLLGDARGQMEAMGIPVPPELLEGLALHREALDDLAGAREAFSNAEASGQEASLSVGVYLRLRDGDFREGAEPARRAAEGNPRSPVALNNLGVSTLQGGDPLRARDLFREAHELDPKLPGPLYNLALLEEFYLMDHEAGAEWFRRYLSLSTADPDSLREVFLVNDSDTTNSNGGN